MATHFQLQLHFCTFCGAYGSKRSYNLQLACPALPTKAGLEVIRLVSLGEPPDTYKARHEERHGKQKLKLKSTSKLAKPRFNSCSRIARRTNKVKTRPKSTSREMPGLKKDTFCEKCLFSGRPFFSTAKAKQPDKVSTSFPRPTGPHTPPSQEQPQSEDASEGGNLTDNEKPLEFSPEGCDFSGLSKGSPLPSVSDPTLGRKRSSSSSSTANSLVGHASCSRHGRQGSWHMTDFCHECDQIAEAALAVSL
jgi:hypothetical protein